MQVPRACLLVAGCSAQPRSRLARRSADRRADPSVPVARGVFCCPIDRPHVQQGPGERRDDHHPERARHARGRRPRGRRRRWPASRPRPAPSPRPPPSRPRASPARRASSARSRPSASRSSSASRAARSCRPTTRCSTPTVRHVLVRHEQGAGHAATGYAQATGKVGVCMATSGPGRDEPGHPAGRRAHGLGADRGDHRPGAQRTPSAPTPSRRPTSAASRCR